MRADDRADVCRVVSVSPCVRAHARAPPRLSQNPCGKVVVDKSHVFTEKTVLRVWAIAVDGALQVGCQVHPVYFPARLTPWSVGLAISITLTSDSQKVSYCRFWCFAFDIPRKLHAVNRVLTRWAKRRRYAWYGMPWSLTSKHPSGAIVTIVPITPIVPLSPGTGHFTGGLGDAYISLRAKKSITPACSGSRCSLLF